MRAFCLISTLGLIVASIWLYTIDMKVHSFLAAFLVYPLGYIVLAGEAFGPFIGSLPTRPYQGEFRNELISRTIEDLQKHYPDKKWLSNFTAFQTVVFLGFIVWTTILASFYLS
jgi:hypothetical protein